MSLLAIVSQGGAEYMAMSARNAGTAPALGVRQIVDGVLAYVSDHTLMVIAAVLAFVMVVRFFMTPKVR